MTLEELVGYMPAGTEYHIDGLGRHIGDMFDIEPHEKWIPSWGEIRYNRVLTISINEDEEFWVVIGESECGEEDDGR